MSWRWFSVLAMGSAACGADTSVPTFPLSAMDSSSEATPDRVASCDEAADGTPCEGPAGQVSHCIFDACVVNACGDGFPAGAEECDDGDESDGDGCSALCRKEICGNRRKDLGEACDDGNTVDGDGCSAACEIEIDMDAGGIDSGVVAVQCPLFTSELEDQGIVPALAPAGALQNQVVPISAAATEGAEGAWGYLNLEDLAAGRKSDGFGDLVAPQTTWVCPLLEGNRPTPYSYPYELSYFVTKEGCPPVRRASAPIRCFSADYVPDAGGPDAGGGAQDAGSQGDAGGEADAGQQTDAGGMDAGMAPETLCGDGIDNDLNGNIDCDDANCQIVEPTCEFTSECEQCMRDNCGVASGIDLAGPCFDALAPGFGGTTPQPQFSQICIDTVECSYNASTNCFLDSIGPSQCYCGEITLGQCEGSGPDVATSPCKLAWEKATLCDGIADPVAKNGCVTGAFQDLTKPAGYAFFLSNCAAASCSAECTN